MGDVAWHQKHEHLFGSVGDDQYMLIWDLRAPSVSKPVQSVVAHQSEVGIFSYCPKHSFLVMICSSSSKCSMQLCFSSNYNPDSITQTSFILPCWFIFAGLVFWTLVDIP